MIYLSFRVIYLRYVCWSPILVFRNSNSLGIGKIPYFHFGWKTRLWQIFLGLEFSVERISFFEAQGKIKMFPSILQWISWIDENSLNSLITFFGYWKCWTGERVRSFRRGGFGSSWCSQPSAPDWKSGSVHLDDSQTLPPPSMKFCRVDFAHYTFCL